MRELLTDESYETNHLAGIIPLAGFKSDLDCFPHHPSLNIIGKNYLAIERSLVECAYAGCKTIWVIVDDDWQPIIRKRLGEFMPDPVSLTKSSYTRFPSEHHKYIPIFYVPVHPKDRDKRDSFAWSMIHGCLMSFIASSKLSKWVQPNRYYISSPYGVYDPDQPLLRASLRRQELVMIDYNGKNITTPEHLGFSLSPTFYKEVVRHVKKNKSAVDSYRLITTRELFLPLLKNNVDFLKVKEYYNISEWRLYRDFLQSKLFRELKRPKILEWRDKNGD